MGNSGPDDQSRADARERATAGHRCGSRRARPAGFGRGVREHRVYRSGGGGKSRQPHEIDPAGATAADGRWSCDGWQRRPHDYYYSIWAWQNFHKRLYWFWAKRWWPRYRFDRVIHRLRLVGLPGYWVWHAHVPRRSGVAPRLRQGPRVE